MLIEKNIYCFYTLKIDISISFPTTWYSDIVYSDQLVRMHAFGKHFSRCESNSMRGEVKTFVRKGRFKSTEQ